MVTIKTSNSSKHLNGDSAIDQSERMKQTVEKERSPPDKDFMSSRAALFPSPGWTFSCIKRRKNELKIYISISDKNSALL